MKRTAALSIASLGILLFTSVAPASAQSLSDIGRVILNNVVGGSSYYDPYYSGYYPASSYYPSSSYYSYPSSYYGYPSASYYGTSPYYSGYGYNSYPSYNYGSNYYYNSGRNVAGRVLDWLF